MLSGKQIWFLLPILILLSFFSSCGPAPGPEGKNRNLTAECINHFKTRIELCSERRPLSDKVQDGSLLEIKLPSGKTLKVAAYYSPNYSLCLPRTYGRYVKEGESVDVYVLRCGYTNNRPVCPWKIEIGKASWYGYGDGSGKWTASERPFNPETFGLANRELPFGTLVKITNLENGRSVYAVVLDRGPFVKGRQFDLYPKTMRALGGIKQGVIPVKVEVIRCGWPVK
jgi:rare lipoprotein A